MNLIDILPYEEQIPLRLRAIYESYGYKKYGMSNFEPYDLYRENRNFIKGGGIITFTAANGSLMALRPDVTTSIVKHAAGDKTGVRKLYYIENVFRMRHKTGEFNEIRQMGLEYIGGDSGYSEAEVVFLALKSLNAFDADYRLNISHMGLVEGMLEYLGADAAAVPQIKNAVKQKNIHELASLARQSGAGEEKINALGSIMSVSGDFCAALKKISDMAVNDTMREAAACLSRLYETVGLFIDAGSLKFDLSVINDMDYYNGTVFRGYVREASGAVLSGGRYDNMMRRFGDSRSALGFALYLGELDRAFHSGREYDVDVLLLQNGLPPSAVAAAVKKLSDEALSVCVGSDKNGGVRARRTMIMTEKGAEEVLV